MAILIQSVMTNLKINILPAATTCSDSTWKFTLYFIYVNPGSHERQKASLIDLGKEYIDRFTGGTM